MEQVPRRFIPAFGRDWARPLYDPVVKLIGGDRARRTLVGAAIRPGQRVLDMACGSGRWPFSSRVHHP